jgi:hypothetical protein
VWAGSPDTYDYEQPESFIDGLVIEFDPDIGEDLNDDDFPDNSFGALFGALMSLPGAGENFDLNRSIATSIEEGDFQLGAAWPGLPATLLDVSDVQLDIFNLVDTDDNPATRDEFRVDRDSFDGADPIVSFVDGSIDGRALDIRSSLFQVPVAFGGVVVVVAIHDAHLTGTVGQDANGITLTDGTLSGAVDVEELFAIFNAIIAGMCPCIDGPLWSFEEGSCQDIADFSGCGENRDSCAQVGNVCSLIPNLLAGAADLDRDGDEENDALSVFFHISMQGTDLVGPHGLPPPDADFHRGDSNGDGGIDIGDGVFTFSFLFLGGASPSCNESADTNNDGGIDVSDGIAVLNYLFLGGVPPADPGPVTDPCGPDPDAPGSDGDSGCAVYRGC